MKAEYDASDPLRLPLAAALGLFANGQSTEQTVETAERLAKWEGVDASLFPRWGELILQSNGISRPLTHIVKADPTGIDMTRVAGILQAAEQALQGRLTAEQASSAIETAKSAPPPATWIFAIAAAAGALALAIIFGVQHTSAGLLIVASAGAGAVVRRLLARITSNPFVQPFAAALLAGLIGGIADRLQLSSALRLVAVCPCMVLVPGPHFLNGGLDLLRGRVHLGASQLIFATLVVTAICCGLLFGLGAVGVTLPVDPPGRSVSLPKDVAAAAVAVAAYNVFFNTPLKMFPWPMAIGAAAHALRWVVISIFGFGPAGAALVACLLVGTLMTPIADRLRVPFAAAGFAAVVSLIPGVLLFRMAGGVVQIAGGVTALALMRNTITDGVTAAVIVLGMALGLLAPKLIIDALSNNHSVARAQAWK